MKTLPVSRPRHHPAASLPFFPAFFHRVRWCKMENRGRITVKAASLPPGRLSVDPPQPEWRQRLEAWRSLLAQCGRKPGRKNVHVLRSLTLRLRTGLGNALEPIADPDAARAFQRWSKEAKKLRKALEPVRNADVYMARLDSLRHISKGETPLSPRCICEIDKLENRLKRKRQAETDKLKAVIAARGKRLNRLSREMEVALESHMPASVASTAPAAWRVFAALTGEFPALDEDNLHAYRKGLKQALYLAELSARTDSVAGRLATALRKMRDAAGEWHDWQSLAQEADHALRGHGRQDSLVPLLDELTAKALQKALGRCRRSSAQLLKSAGGVPAAPRKKPVAADRGFQPRNASLPLKISA